MVRNRHGRIKKYMYAYSECMFNMINKDNKQFSQLKHETVNIIQMLLMRRKLALQEFRSLFTTQD